MNNLDINPTLICTPTSLIFFYVTFTSNNNSSEYIKKFLQLDNFNFYRDIKSNNILKENKEIINNSCLYKVFTFIDENLEKKIKIHDLANLVFMSESNFYRVFKIETGVSPIKYIIKKKIIFSKKILLEEGNNIDEIAFRLSYTKRGFLKFFKNETGLTPKQFIKNPKNNFF